MRLAGRALRARGALSAGARTARGGPAPIRFLSRFRTSDRLGTRRYARGDPPGQLVWRDLLLRDEAVVRTYRAVAELRVRVALDPRPSLLGHDQTGPFAVKLALCLALTGLGGRHPTGLSFFGLLPPTGEASHPKNLGGFVEALARLGPTAAPRGFDPVAGLAAACAGARANINLFAIIHIGYAAAALDRLLRLLREQVEQATIFVVAAAEDFFLPDRRVADPETGRVVAAPADPAAHLADYFDRAVALGRQLGVRVEPLVVRDHAADMETVLGALESGT
jgi:uncharacterized protein (DUF58 family)